MRIIFFFIIVLFSQQLNAQSFTQLRKDATALYEREAWDELLDKATEMMVVNPYSGFGYYYASWANLKMANFDEATRLFKEADEWAESVLIEELMVLQQVVERVNSDEGKVYRAFLKGDKTVKISDLHYEYKLNPADTALGVEVIERYIDNKQYFEAYELLKAMQLEYESYSKPLYSKLIQNSDVRKKTEANALYQKSEEAFENKKYKEAYEAYVKAEALYPKYSASFKPELTAWMSFENARQKHTFEAYEEVLNLYGSYAEIKVECIKILKPSYVSQIKKDAEKYDIQSCISYYNRYIKIAKGKEVEEVYPAMAKAFYHWVDIHSKSKYDSQGPKKAIVMYNEALRFGKPHASIEANMKKVIKKWKKTHGALPTKI